MKSHNRFKRRVGESGGASEVARRLAVSRQTIYYLMNGERRPGRDLALRIEDVLGMPAREWAR